MKTRKKHTLVIKCDEPGCTELSHLLEFDTLAERNTAYSKYSSDKNFCLRHKNKNEVLSPINRVVRWGAEYVSRNADAEQFPNIQDKNFWYSNEVYSGCGFIHGDHWQAWAKDFPRGTKIVINVTATAILPD